mgnify:CR=1 FL=1
MSEWVSDLFETQKEELRIQWKKETGLFIYQIHKRK